MTESERKNRIKRIVEGLKCTEAEAIEILEADIKIDRGERMEFDLSKEAEKTAIKDAHKGYTERKKPTVYKFDKRERKVNQTKKDIIEYLFECFKDYENVAVTNAERQIKFSANGNDYELTLVQKRKPKA